MLPLQSSLPRRQLPQAHTAGSARSDRRATCGKHKHMQEAQHLVRQRARGPRRLVLNRNPLSLRLKYSLAAVLLSFATIFVNRAIMLCDTYGIISSLVCVAIFWLLIPASRARSRGNTSGPALYGSILPAAGSWEGDHATISFGGPFSPGKFTKVSARTARPDFVTCGGHTPPGWAPRPPTGAPGPPPRPHSLQKRVLASAWLDRSRDVTREVPGAPTELQFCHAPALATPRGRDIGI